MFFHFSKLVQPLLWPMNIAMLLLAASLVALCWDRKRLAFRLTFGATAILFFCSLPVTARWLLGSLESIYPIVPVGESAKADAIVVLGTTVWARQSPRVEIEEAGGSRLIPGARLFRAGKAPHIVVSSGVRYATRPGEWRTESEDMRDFLLMESVPAAAIVEENHSRNTDENARYTADIFRERGWKTAIVVTSAFHMRRSMAMFRKYGIAVTQAFPTEPKIAGERRLSDWMPDLMSLQSTTLAIRERVGYWVYR